MEVKLFEIRDVATFIPIMCIRLSSRNEEERYLLSRAGYGQSLDDQSKYYTMVQINGGSGKAACDPYEWGGGTYSTAHNYIEVNWDSLQSGQVIDVEFIRGESLAPKVSERIGRV